MTGISSGEGLSETIAADHPLADIVKRAYEVFQYDTPVTTGVCVNCCMNPDIEADFFTPDIRNLPFRYLQDWFTGAYSRAGVPKAVWGYLLPRILELLAIGHTPSHSLELSLSRFQTGDQRNWTDVEWDILDQFQKVFLKLRAQQGRDHLDDVVCMFALSGWTLPQLQEQVLALADVVLIKRLHHDWGHRLPNIALTPFWSKDDKETMRLFYISRALHDRVERVAFCQDDDPALADMAIEVLTAIENEPSIWRG